MYEEGMNFPNSVPIDLSFDNEWEANNLPPNVEPDYIFSSHCLEHVPDWVATMDYWYENFVKEELSVSPRLQSKILETLEQL